jgi:hypothetical protein
MRRLCGGLLVLALVSEAAAVDRFVSVTGSDAGNDCQQAITPCATLEHATGVAGTGDVVKLAKGTIRTPRS